MLQGSLDNFALDEVLGLLSSTAKTGQLDLKGDRGVGALMLQQGRLVDANASNTANGFGPEDVLFELLRFENGTFNFTARDVEGSETPRDIGDVLASAEARLADWRTIEAVIPSLAHLVSPARSLPAEEMTVSSAEWSTIVVIGTGCQVTRVCDELALGEVEGSRQIKGLVERGLVNIGPPTAARTLVASDRPANDERPEPIAKDPFARRAELSSPSSSPSPSSSSFSNDESIGSGSDAEVGIASGIRGGATSVSAFSPPTTERPPMPPTPTIEELTGSAAPSHSSPPPIASHKNSAGNGNGAGNGNSAGNGNGSQDGDKAGNGKDDGKSGGLLMRYLKNDD